MKNDAFLVTNLRFTSLAIFRFEFKEKGVLKA